MKKNLLAGLLLLVCFICRAESPYELYKISGNVEIKARYTEVWKAAGPNQAAEANDSLRIPQKGSVAILHKQSGQIFHSSCTGTVKVYDIVKQARQQSSSTLSLITQQMKEQIKNSKASVTYSQAGVSNRSEEDEAYEDTLALYLRKIAFESFSGNSRKSDSISARADNTNGELTFTISSNSTRPKVVNILRVDGNTRRIGLVYQNLPADEAYIIIAPHEEIEINDTRVANLSNVGYIVFATEWAFDSNLLNGVIQYESIDTDVDITIEDFWYTQVTL